MTRVRCSLALPFRAGISMRSKERRGKEKTLDNDCPWGTIPFEGVRASHNITRVNREGKSNDRL